MRIRRRVAFLTIILAVCRLAGGQSPTPSLIAIHQLLSSKDYASALAMDEALLVQQPNSQTLWLARAISLRGLTRTKDSLNAFNHVLTLQPSNVPALQGASEAAFLLKDPSAQTLIEKLLRFTPKDPVANAIAGSLAYERGDCPTAIQYFAEGKSEVETNTTAGLQLSHCLLTGGQATEAVTILQQIPAHDSDTLISYDLAFALFAAGRFEESAARLERLRDQHAGGADALDLLGAAYSKLERVQDALDTYRSACDEAPTTPGYYIDLAMFAMEHSSEPAAIQVLNTGIQNIPRSAALLTFRGSIYAFLGDPGKADEDFTGAERADPSSGFGQVGRSLAIRDQGKIAEAETELRQELKINPHDVEARYFLAKLLVDDNIDSNHNEARLLLEDVLKEMPDDPNALLMLSTILLQDHDPKAALPLLLHAQQVDPKSAPILNRLLQDFRALGLKEDASKTADSLRQIIGENRDAEARRNRFHINATAQ
jgi:tetratricopeptide (TPR) repeat protein